MPAFTATAPGKAILFGEHAVVYGRPAIAVPVIQVQAKATVSANLGGTPGQVLIDAPDIDLHASAADLAPGHPLAVGLETIMRYAGAERLPALRLKLTSTIPVASGLGSGAAVSVAMARALGAFLGRPFSDEEISAIAYEVEKVHHGTPSGIDNTVIAYARPVYFVRGRPLEMLRVRSPFTLVVADSGVQSVTSAVVGDLRRRRQEQPVVYEARFDTIGEIAEAARQAVEQGPLAELGALMNANHQELQALGVSSPELDRLVAAARESGAAGAKLSGAGWGGNMIALVAPEQAGSVANALEQAGALRTIVTTVQQVEAVSSEVDPEDFENP